MQNIDSNKINPSTLLGAKKAHFIGIGGIGVSAVARMMLANGSQVSGSDTAESPIAKELENLGAKIFYAHEAENVPSDAGLAVYTPAIHEDNPEFVRAKELGITAISYPQALGLISQNKFTIAISGAHGKTTTTAMIGKILEEAGLDPTIIVGSLMNGNHSNFAAGKGKYFVVEACEYKKSFLNITHPNIIVITNIDGDHLDYYGSLENVKKAFSEFASKLGKEDWLVCNSANENVADVARGASPKIVDYTKEATGDLNLKVPGKHNLENAQAALAVAEILGIDRQVAKKALESFTGTWRRFEHKGKTKDGAIIYDDYAHHPTEIKATLKAAKDFFAKQIADGGRLLCVFQPHLYSRTKLLFNDFAESFNDAGLVVLADIYAAREEFDESISSKMLADEINKCGGSAKYLGGFDEIEKFLEENTGENDVIITMGAGDVYKIGEKMLG